MKIIKFGFLTKSFTAHSKTFLSSYTV